VTIESDAQQSAAALQDRAVQIERSQQLLDADIKAVKAAAEELDIKERRLLEWAHDKEREFEMELQSRTEQWNRINAELGAQEQTLLARDEEFRNEQVWLFCFSWSDCLNADISTVRMDVQLSHREIMAEKERELRSQTDELQRARNAFREESSRFMEQYLAYKQRVHSPSTLQIRLLSIIYCVSLIQAAADAISLQSRADALSAREYSVNVAVGALEQRNSELASAVEARASELQDAQSELVNAANVVAAHEEHLRATADAMGITSAPLSPVDSIPEPRWEREATPRLKPLPTLPLSLTRSGLDFSPAVVGRSPYNS
jgi:hypothetical protein